VNRRINVKIKKTKIKNLNFAFDLNCGGINIWETPARFTPIVIGGWGKMVLTSQRICFRIGEYDCNYYYRGCLDYVGCGA